MDFINLKSNILNLSNEDLLKEILKYENINLIKIDDNFLIFELIYYAEVLDFLLNKKYLTCSDINIKDGNGMTPLNCACELVDVRVVKILLDNGAKMDIKNIYKNTPLHTACFNNNTKAAKILFEYGCSTFINFINFYGERPIDIACEYGNIKLVELLLSYGAEIKCDEEGNYECLKGLTDDDIPGDVTVEEMKKLIFSYTSFRFKKPRT